MKLCTIDDCSKKHKARGLCRKHYLQHQRHGTLPPTRFTPRTTCIYVDCDRPHKTNNLCAAHYRWQLNPLKDVRPQQYCNVDGCNDITKAHGRCSKHYQLSRYTRSVQELADDREKFLEEYEFFRSWRMTDDRLAECLHISVDTLQKRVERWVTPELQVAS